MTARDYTERLYLAARRMGLPASRWDEGGRTWVIEVTLPCQCVIRQSWQDDRTRAQLRETVRTLRNAAMEAQVCP